MLERKFSMDLRYIIMTISSMARLIFWLMIFLLYRLSR